MNWHLIACNCIQLDRLAFPQVVVDEIVDGIDELGILVMGTLPALSAEAAPKHYSFWFVLH